MPCHCPFKWCKVLLLEKLVISELGVPLHPELLDLWKVPPNWRPSICTPVVMPNYCCHLILQVPTYWCLPIGAHLFFPPFSDQPFVQPCWCPPLGAPLLVPTSLEGVHSKPCAPPVWSADKQTIGWLVLISWTAAYQRTRLYIDASNSYRSHITLVEIIVSPKNHFSSRN